MSARDEFKSSDNRRKNFRRGERGNIFFTLFGAVAIIGVLGAAIMATMRGPLSTMVEVNHRTQAETQMSIASKLVLLQAAQDPANSGDCDSDGFVEPIEYKDPGGDTNYPHGGGFLPDVVGSEKQDPWGTNYGYCVWDAGTVTDAPGCGGSSAKRLHGNGLGGAAGETYTIIAIISAGPDRTFQTTCSDTPSPAVSKGGDDMVSSFDYQAAAAASGGLWTLKSGAPDTAQIAKNLDVTGAATFSNGIDLSEKAAAPIRLGQSSLFVPTSTDLAPPICNGANNGILRVNMGTNPISLEICDNAAAPPGWKSVSAGASNSPWTVISASKINFGAATDNYDVGINNASPNEALDIGGNIQLTGDVKMSNGQKTLWASGANITESSGNVQIDANGGAGSEITASANAVALSATTITGTTTDNTAAGLIVKDSAATPILFVRNDGHVGIGDPSPANMLSVAGNIDTTTSYKIDNFNILKSDATMSNTVLLGNDAGKNVTGDNNTILGADAAGALTSGKGDILIGKGVDVPNAGVDDYLNLGDVIHGDLQNKKIGVGYADKYDVAGLPATLSVNGLIWGSGNITANADVIANADVSAVGNVSGNNLRATTAIFVHGDQLGPVAECLAAEKLQWTTGVGWTCVTDATGGGSGSGGAVTFEDTLSNGNDANTLTALNLGGVAIGSNALSTGGVHDLVLDVTGAAGADFYCDSAGNNCFSSAGVAGISDLWEVNSGNVRTKDASAAWATSNFLFGSPQMDNDATAAHYGRMFFNKAKKAFRAGYADSAQWDNANVGTYSIALGYDATASGNYSMAWSGSTASGGGSTAWGFSAASGVSSTAWGSNSIASGDYSTVFGYKTKAGSGTAADGKGDYSLAVGLGANTAANATEYPKVEGVGSVGLFMGDQKNLNISNNNIMALLGGRMVIDPASPATHTNVSTGDQQLELDVFGDIGAVNYCDETGSHCFTPAQAAQGGTSVLSAITAATQTNSIASGDFGQTWNWTLTTADNVAFTYGETAASTATGKPVILEASTLAASTATPFLINNLGDGNSFEVDDEAADTTPFVIDKDGKVGIGVAAPKFQFHSSNAAAAAGAFESIDSGTTLGNTSALFIVNSDPTVNNYASLAFSDRQSQNNPPVKLAAQYTDRTSHYGDFIIGTRGPGGMDERLRVTSTGNIGIDQTAPDTKLMVNGSVRIGDGNETCSGGNFTGALRYHLSRIEFCDGTAWNILVGSASGGVELSSIIAATKANSINNLAWAQAWNWALTGAGAAFTFGENTAASGGSNDQYILEAKTLATSTAMPLHISNLGAGRSFQVDANGGKQVIIDKDGALGVGGAPASTLDVESPHNQIARFVSTTGGGVGYISVMGQFNNAGINLGSSGLSNTRIEGNNTNLNLFSASFAYPPTMTLADTGKVGFGSQTPSYLLSLIGESAATIGMERTTAGTDGFGLTLQSGGAKSGQNNKNGGDLALSSGIATGDGYSSIVFQTVQPHQGTGNTDRNPQPSMVLSSNSLTLPNATTATRPGAANMQAAAAGMIYYDTANGKFEAYQGGQWQDILTSAAGNQVAISSLTDATKANTIDNLAWAQTWGWTTLAGGNGLNLTAAGTTALTGETLLNVAVSGANGTAAQTTYAGQFANTHTGAGTNIGLYATASGGATNYAAILDGPAKITNTNALYFDNGVAQTYQIGINTVGSQNGLDFQKTGYARTGFIGPHSCFGYLCEPTDNASIALNNRGNLSTAFQAANGAAYILRVDNVLQAAANNDTLYSLYLGTTYDDNSKSGVVHTDIGINGDGSTPTTTPRTMTVDRNTTAAKEGYGLAITAGGAKSGSTDKAGGDLTLSSGIATGAGYSSIIFQTVKPGQASAATDRLPAVAMTLATNALTLPSGPTAEQPGSGGMQGSVNGMIRYDTDLKKFEAYQDNTWQDILTSATGNQVAISSLTAATKVNTIDNLAWAQAWNWALTGAGAAFSYGETTAASGGSNDQYILEAKTLATSTAMPFHISNLGAGRSFQVDANGGKQVIVDKDGNVGIGAAPTSQLTLAGKTLGGASSTDNFINVTGTFNNSNSTTAIGMFYTITSNGSSAANQIASRTTLASGYTGSLATQAGSFLNQAAGNGVGFWTGAGNNIGVVGQASGTTNTGHNSGAFFSASHSDILNAGVKGQATTASPGLNLGVVGVTSSGGVNVGGFFGLTGTVDPVIAASAALIADNGGLAAPIFVGRDNGTEVFRIADGGNVGIGTTAPVAALDVQAAETVIGPATVAYGIRQQQTITAAANNDALYGLYLNTTYADGAFTGVMHTDIGINGDGSTPTTTPRTMTVDRNATAAKEGYGLAITAGGAKLASTDKAGGDMILSSGIATGAGYSSIIFKTVKPGQASAATDRLPAVAMTLATNALTLPSGPTAEQPGTGTTQTPVNGMIRYDTDLKKFEAYQDNVWQDILTSAAGNQTAISALTAATKVNTIDNLAWAQNWGWSALAGGNGLALSSTSTLATGDTQTVLNVATNGANANNTQTTYGAKFSNTHTGTGSTNIGLYAAASGGATNYAAEFNGNIHVPGLNTIYLDNGVAYNIAITNNNSQGVGFGLVNYGGFANLGLRSCIGYYCTTSSNTALMINNTVGGAATSASGGAAYTLQIAGITQASANNDKLYQLYINPSYDDNSKSGVSHVDLGIDGSAARIIAMTNNPTAASVGNNLTLQAGGATTGSSNKAGGDLILTSGLPTGTGDLKVYIKAYQDAGQIDMGVFDGTLNSVSLGLAYAPTSADTFAAGGYAHSMAGGCVAVGYNTSCSGSASAAFGSNGQAQGYYGVVLSTNSAYAKNDYSLALGSQVWAGDGVAGHGDYAMAIGLGAPVSSGGTMPKVVGDSSLGIFMGDQGGASVSASKVMALAGGRMFIDPATPATHTNVSSGSQLLELDVYGDVGADNYCDSAGNNCFTPISILTGVTPKLNSLLAADNTNSINSLDFAQSWAWNTLSSNSALTLSSNSTLASGNTQTLLNIDLSGTNGTGGHATYGVKISNTHAGATSTNVGLYATASGGTTANYAAIFDQGNVGIGMTAPTAKLYVDSDTSQSIANFQAPNSGSSGNIKVAGQYAGEIFLGNGCGAECNRIQGNDGDHALYFYSNGAAGTGMAFNGLGLSLAPSTPPTLPNAGLDVLLPRTVVGPATAAYGGRFQQTLKANANNDTLNALYINPTFDDNGKSGVKHNGLIVTSGNVGLGTAAPVDPVSIGTAINASATHALVNLSNAALVGGSANGTYIGLKNATFNGDYFNFQGNDWNGVNLTKFKVSYGGALTLNAGDWARNGLIIEPGTGGNGTQAAYIHTGGGNMYSGNNNPGYYIHDDIDLSITGANPDNFSYMKIHPGGGPWGVGPWGANLTALEVTNVWAGNVPNVVFTGKIIGETISPSYGNVGVTDRFTGAGLIGLQIAPTINIKNTSTSPAIALLINQTEKSTSAGVTNYLARMQTTDASAVTTDKFVVTSTGYVGIGDATPDSGTGGQLFLDVAGPAGATKYCDDSGNNCFTAASVAGGSSIDSLSDAVYDITVDHNMVLGSNTAPTSGAINNIWIGEGAGHSTTNDADDNTAVGYQALTANTTGGVNTALGSNALTSNTIGYGNTAIGWHALQNNTTGNRNVALGYYALALARSNYNVAIGHAALSGLTGGNGGNLVIGPYIAGGSLVTGENNILIGSVDTPSATDASNTLNIGNAIYGTGIYGGATKIGIGTASPSVALSVKDSLLSTSPLFSTYTIGQTQINDALTNTANVKLGTAAIFTQADVAANSATKYNGLIVETSSASANAFTYGALRGMNAAAVHNGTNTVNSVLGSIDSATNNSTGTISLALGTSGGVTNASSGTITSAAGVKGSISLNGSGPVTSGYGGEFEIFLSGSGTMTTAAGVKIDDFSNTGGGTITTGYGLYIGSVLGTSKWSLYASDAATPSYFAGNVGMGPSMSAPAAYLQLGAGTIAAGTAPLKFTTGPVLTAPEDGAVEYDGTHFYATVGSTRYQLDQQGGGAIKIDDLTDAVYDITNDHNMVLGSNTAPVTGAAGNIWIGEGAGASTTNAADNNIALGYQALHANTTAAANVAIGYQAGLLLTTGGSNVILGTSAGAAGTSMTNTVIIGANAGAANTRSYNTIVGFNAGLVNTNKYIDAFGSYALFSNTTGTLNTAIGSQTLTANTSGSNNVAVGGSALATGSGSFWEATSAMYATTTGSNNTAVGYSSFANNKTGGDSAAFGYNAALFTEGGNYNTAFGDSALASVEPPLVSDMLSGSNNTAVGGLALQNARNGAAGNTALGFTAGGKLTTGSSNVMLGLNVGSTTLTTGSSNILIGASNAVDTPLAATSNFLNIGNTIFATNVGTGTVAAPAGYVGIGTSAPTNKLEVVGGTLTSTQKAFSVTGTLDSTVALQQGVSFAIASGAGVGSNNIDALVVSLTSGYTGTGITKAIGATNRVVGGGTGGLVATGAGNYGAQMTVNGAGAGHNIGSLSQASASSALNVGSESFAILNTTSPTLNIGSASFALSGANNVGGFFGLMTGAPTIAASAALMADNGAVAADIFEGRDNGSVVFTIADGGNVGIGVTSPTAYLHLKAGTAAAGTAPLKLTSGVLLGTKEDGAIEYDGTHYYATVGTTRYQLDQQSSGTIPAPVTTTIRVVTAAGAITVSATTDYYVCVNKTVGAATTVNLPASPATGLTYIIKDCKGDANTNNISIVPNAGTIDGLNPYIMSTAYQAVGLTYNGTSWNAN